jgi:hypothetical protein
MVPPGINKQKTKETEMSYKKPQIVAKSTAKQSFVAGCPTNSYSTGYKGRCHPANAKCNLTPLK